MTNITAHPDALTAAFEETFGAAPAVLVRAPGRVNLIGEHTDYSNLPVLPMAIDRAILVAARPNESGVIRARSLTFEGELSMEREATADRVPGWQRYLAAASQQLANASPGLGADLLLAGDLPSQGGLSSSSALTTGSIAALGAAWGASLEPADLVRLSIASERRVGVESGGMDQEVIVFAEAGAALRIDFDPAARRPIPLPPGLSIVVAFSGEVASKGENARDAYNQRVVGCRIAAAMLADQLGVDVRPGLVLGDVAAIDVVDILVDDLPVTAVAAAIARNLDLPLDAFVRLTAGRIDAQAALPVRSRARHVLAEAHRVELACTLLESPQPDLPRFGRLLNESHNSLRTDYGCSTKALDRVCAAMRRAGAFGARLTGAGFGGFALAACPPEAVSAVVSAAQEAGAGPAFEVHASGGLQLL